MKKVKLIAIVMSLLTVVSANAQKSQETAVKLLITNFSVEGDANDSEKLTTYLDDNYRIVMNQLFGSKLVSVMTKSDYVQKIADKVFGGDQRKVSFESVIINGNTACAIVKLEGKKMTTKSIMTLVKDAAGQWKLISDTPVVI